MSGKKIRSAVRLGWFFMLVTITAGLSAGCSILGVYDSDFKCPASYNGRCISVPAAHELAKNGKDGPDSAAGQIKGQGNESAPEKDLVPRVNNEEYAHNSYKESLYKRFDSLLKDPVTPVVAPPQVMRILLLPYKGDSNELFMLRHVYFFVDEPRWVLGDSLTAIEED